MGGLSALSELMLETPERFLRRGTRAVPATRNALREQAKADGVMIAPMRPLGRDADQWVEFSTKARHKDIPGTAYNVTYSLEGRRPSTLERLAKDRFTLDLPVQASTDPEWMEHFVRNAPKDRMYQTIFAMDSSDAVNGTGAKLYPYMMDWMQLGPNDLNLVTGLTKDNVNRWPVNQIRQYLRTKGDWADHSVPPFDFFADPVRESMATPAERLEALLNAHETNTLDRLKGLSALVQDERLPARDAVELIRRGGVPQIGEATVRQLRGLSAAQDGREADMLRNLGESFRRGGPVSALECLARRSRTP
jgi:hypothetical protein